MFESDLGAVVVEDLRQSSPQPGARGDAVCCCIWRLVGGLSAGPERDPLRAGGGRRGSARRRPRRLGSQAGRPSLVDAPERDRGRAGQAVGTGPDLTLLPPVRRLHQPRRDRTNAPADATGRRRRCWNGRPPATPTKRRRRSIRLLSLHVDWTGDFRRGVCRSGPVPDWVVFGRRAVAGAVAGLADRRLVVKPAAAPASGPPVRYAARFSGQAVPTHLALLRGLRHRSGDTGCRPTISRSTRRRSSPHAPARPISAWRCWRTWPPATSAIAPSAGCSTARGRRSSTLARMERYRGHFYNWYDTRSLKPLLPLYVSTVDSGNLAGGLLVLRSGLLEMVGAGMLPPRLLAGFATPFSFFWTWLVAVTGRSRKYESRWLSDAVLRKIERLGQELENSTRYAGGRTDVLAIAGRRGGGDCRGAGSRRGTALVGQRLRAFLPGPSRRLVAHRPLGWPAKTRGGLLAVRARRSRSSD